MSLYPKNKTGTEKSARNKAQAIEAALEELGVTADEVEIEVLDEGSRGFLGIGARDARVKVTLKNAPKAEEVKKPIEPQKAKESPKAPKPAEKEPKKEGAKQAEKEPKKEGAKQAKRSKPTRESEGSPEADAKKFLSDVFAAMKLDVNIDASYADDTVTINLSGDNMGIVIGKRGDTLDSLQYLTSLVVNQRNEDYIKVSIDTENYREKRTEALLALSNRLAEKVARTGKRFTLEPMNPYERRVIHSNLQDNADVTTYSVGSEPYRKVVIAPKNAKPYKKDGYKKRGSRPSRRGDREKTAQPKQTSSYTATYKADFKPQQHKAEFKSFEDYLAAQHSEDSED